jgi:hypothetical protein
VQREVLGMVKNRLFDGFTPIFTDFMGIKAPKVGRGAGGQPFPHPSHRRSRGFESRQIHIISHLGEIFIFTMPA